MSHDLFISYSRRNLAQVKIIRDELAKQGFSCWMDLEKIPADEANFKNRIMPAIRNSRLAFLFFLSPDSQASENALKELKFAAKRTKTRIIFVRFDAFAMNDAFFFDYSDHDVIDWWKPEQKAKLLQNLTKWEASRLVEQQSGERIKQEGDAGQQQMLAGFMHPAVKRILDVWDELRLLDLGSSAGDLAMSCWGQTEKLRKYLGIDCDPMAVAIGNKRAEPAGDVLFGKADLERAKELEAVVSRGKKVLKISDFNVVHFGMVLTYLNKPCPVLKEAYRQLAPGGFAVVLDIDEGGDMVFPDGDGAFVKAGGIFRKYRKEFGWSKSGRQVYGQLADAGFADICMERAVLSTCGMTREQRQTFFDYRFAPVCGILERMVQRRPKDRSVQADWKWFSGARKNLERRFLDERFFFCLGLLLFSARRPSESVGCEEQRREQ